MCAAGDDRAAGIGDHVHLGADAEGAREVESGFDREAGVRQDEAFVMGLEVIQMSACAVEFGGDVVPRAMGEGLGEVCCTNDFACGFVGLPALKRLVVCEGLLNSVDRGVAGIANS